MVVSGAITSNPLPHQHKAMQHTTTFNGHTILLTYESDGGCQGDYTTAPTPPLIDLIGVEWDGKDLTELLGGSELWEELSDKLKSELA